MRTLAWTCGLLGGATWVLRAVLDLTDSLDATLDPVLLWVGAGLLAVAVLGAGVRLVDRAPLWLRAVVAAGVLALSASLLLVLHGDGEGVLVDGVVGVVAVVLAVAALVRAARSGRDARAARVAARAAGQRRASGSHAR